MLLDTNLEPLHKVSEDMFQTSDIDKILTCPDNPSLLFVSFRGINGVLSLRFFDEKAQKKILNHLKLRNTSLWETLNESDI